MGELLQDPDILKWLKARDRETVERTAAAVLDLVVEVARAEGASAAMVTAICELGTRERIEEVAGQVLAGEPRIRPRVPMEQTEA
jgi:hypothetical protein